MNDLQIRKSLPADEAAIVSLYPEAFPDEDLVPLVRSLLRKPAIAASLVALVDSESVGHGIFTACGVEGSEDTVVLLGPLAVAPKRQRRGIGSAIIAAGLECARQSGASLICVLGDPAYYGRFGFTPEKRIGPPYRLPPEWSAAWQSLQLAESGDSPGGKLAVPTEWRDRALWGP